MVHHYYTGSEISAAVIRREIPGHGMRGETNAVELEGWLNGHGVRAQRHTVDHETVKTNIKTEIAEGRPSILLGYWVDITILHWVVAIGHGNDGLVVMDPWTGSMRVIRWRSFYQLVSGAWITTAPGGPAVIG